MRNFENVYFAYLSLRNVSQITPFWFSAIRKIRIIKPQQTHHTQFNLRNGRYVYTAQCSKCTKLRLFRPFAVSPPGFFTPGSFASFLPLASSLSGSFTPWLIRPLARLSSGLFAPWLVHPLTDLPSHPGHSLPAHPRWIYRWFVIEACVSVYRKVTSKRIITPLINSYFS